MKNSVFLYAGINDVAPARQGVHLVHQPGWKHRARLSVFDGYDTFNRSSVISHTAKPWHLSHSALPGEVTDPRPLAADGTVPAHSPNKE
jgi:hypothetical protein